MMLTGKVDFFKVTEFLYEWHQSYFVIEVSFSNNYCL